MHTLITKLKESQAKGKPYCAFGLDRCTWKGLEGFGRYVWSSVVSYNLLALARAKMQPT